MPRKIVIRIPNWLGDAVMSAPAVYEFARRHADDEITLFGLPLTLSVFENAPFPFHRIVNDRDGAHQGIPGFIKVASILRREKFAEGYLMTTSVSSALFFALGSIPERIGYPSKWNRYILNRTVDSPKDATHQAQRYYHLLNGECPDGLQAKIYLSDEERRRAQVILEEIGSVNRLLIGMSPGASFGTAKRWFPERYAKAAQRCIDELDATVLLFGSPSERDIAETVARQAGEGCINLAGKTGLRETYALIERCQVLLCNDSGAMHVAAAVGAPVVALFGPTDPSDTSPLGHARMINRQVECAPCLQRECPLGHHKCMDEIGVDEVFAVLSEVIIMK